MKKKLYTQTSILSETPIGTPENVQPIISQHLGPPIKKAKTRTKIIKKGSLLIAKQPSPAQASKENVYPRTATQVSSFIISLLCKIVRSMYFTISIVGKPIITLPWPLTRKTLLLPEVIS